MNRQVTGAEDPPPFQPSLPDNPQSAESSGAPAGDNEGGLAETAPEIKIADPLREGSEGGPPGEGEDIAEETPPAAGEPETSAAARAAPQQSPELRERGLYFIMIDPEGDIVRIKVTRQLPLSDSPMLDVLNSLTAGPNREEQNRGLVSLIPGNSRILNATVRGSTAYISFSEEFQYNPHGVEGYAASLRQIIWTVTEFSNVKDVQILVEGRRVDYLGEGIWIGSPINRTF